ncbi:MAG: hypothetical protein ACRDRU_29155 [Pseudonocardiaceae bacterium]
MLVLAQANSRARSGPVTRHSPRIPATCSLLGVQLGLLYRLAQSFAELPAP